MQKDLLLPAVTAIIKERSVFHMSLQNTPSSERVHIGFFGCRNAGKSSLVNAVTGQELAVVSNVPGTTTDPVQKAMELLPLGPVVIIDTPGFDDLGMLGEKRVQKTRQTLAKTDIAVLVADGIRGLSDSDLELVSLFQEKKLPWLLIWNKADLTAAPEQDFFLTQLPSDASGCGQSLSKETQIAVSAHTGYHIFELKERLAHLLKELPEKKLLVRDLLQPGSVVVLVTPIDESAPKGRMILPQQMMIRDVLDGGCMAFVTKETELKATLQALQNPPALVITDSQAFGFVSKVVPPDIPLTSFSILMARYKGFLGTAVAGIQALDTLQDGDTVLIAEGCTHHRQCNDIGTVKIPRWLLSSTEKRLTIRTCSGTEFPEDLSGISLVIHCGGCMLNEREIQSRMQCAVSQHIPFTNYGILISKMNGILERALKPLECLGSKQISCLIHIKTDPPGLLRCPVNFHLTKKEL